MVDSYKVYVKRQILKEKLQSLLIEEERLLQEKQRLISEISKLNESMQKGKHPLLEKGWDVT